MTAKRMSCCRFLGRAVVCCLVMSLCSCSRYNRPPLVPVQGQVFLESTPAHKAVVWFHPVGPVQPGSPRPRGVVDRDGSFTMGTHKSGDGAPAGKYRVAIYWKAPVRSGDQDGESLIPYRYMDPDESGLPLVEVQEDPVTLPPFRLTLN